MITLLIQQFNGLEKQKCLVLFSSHTSHPQPKKKFLTICLINDTGLIKLDKSLVLPSQVYNIIVMGGRDFFSLFGKGP